MSASPVSSPETPDGQQQMRAAIREVNKMQRDALSSPDTLSADTPSERDYWRAMEILSHIVTMPPEIGKHTNVPTADLRTLARVIQAQVQEIHDLRALSSERRTLSQPHVSMPLRDAFDAMKADADALIDEFANLTIEVDRRSAVSITGIAAQKKLASSRNALRAALLREKP